MAVERCLNLVKRGSGIVAMILPDGILNGDRNSYVREYIQKESTVLAIIGLNKETFQGYNASVKTSIIIMRRKQNPDEQISKEVFMAVCSNSGYAPTGQQVPGNQLPDILFDFRNYLQDKKFDPLYKYSKVVLLDGLKDRLDAERYIPINEALEIFQPNVVSLSINSEVDILGEQIVRIYNSVKDEYLLSDFEFIITSKLLKVVKNTIHLKKDQEYVRLGISGKGNGIFQKEPTLGSQIKTNRLNQVKEGWFMYSRLFAHNGSFGFVNKETAGGVVSGEFPTFELIFKKFEKEDMLEYLSFYYASPQVISLITRLTTGSTKESRARFKEEQFLKLYVPIPKTELKFLEIVSSIRQIKEFKKDVRKLHERIEDLPVSFRSILPFKE